MKKKVLQKKIFWLTILFYRKLLLTQKPLLVWINIMDGLSSEYNEETEQKRKRFFLLKKMADQFFLDR